MFGLHVFLLTISAKYYLRHEHSNVKAVISGKGYPILKAKLKCKFMQSQPSTPEQNYFLALLGGGSSFLVGETSLLLRPLSQISITGNMVCQIREPDTVKCSNSVLHAYAVLVG